MQAVGGHKRTLPRQWSVVWALSLSHPPAFSLDPSLSQVSLWLLLGWPPHNSSSTPAPWPGSHWPGTSPPPFSFPSHCLASAYLTLLVPRTNSWPCSSKWPYLPKCNEESTTPCRLHPKCPQQSFFLYLVQSGPPLICPECSACSSGPGSPSTPCWSTGPKTQGSGRAPWHSCCIWTAGGGCSEGGCKRVPQREAGVVG